MKKVVIIALAVCSICFCQSKVGSSAASFLGAGVGSRAIGMGGAFSAMGGDASVLYWNPGAMAELKQSELLISKANWLVGSDLNYLASIFKLAKGKSVGLYLLQLDYGKEEITTLNEQDGTGQFWSAMDYVLGFSYGSKLSNRFSFGGTGKFISQRIHHTSANSFATDLGLIYKTPSDKIRIGMSISNFGSDMTMDGKDLYKKIDIDPNNSGHNESLVARLKTDPWPLPLFFRAGASFQIMNFESMIGTLAFDTFIPSDDVEIINVGYEMVLFDKSHIQIGYSGIGNQSSEEGFTMGGGTSFYAGGFDLRLDYSFRSFGLFGDIHYFSIAFLYK